VIKEMDDLKTGQQLFEYPNYIAISNSGDIFVTDSGTRTITQTDLTLCNTQTITNPILKPPLGIVFVNTDQLLVAVPDDHSIVALNLIRGTVTPLLGKKDGIRKPRAVAWCPASKKLYVSLGHNVNAKFLKVFNHE